MAGSYWFPVMVSHRRWRAAISFHLCVVKLEGHRQGGAEPLFPVFAPDEEGIVVASGIDIHRTSGVTSSVFIRVTMGMGAFIQSAKASTREVLLGSTSLILFSILFVKSGSFGRGK